MKAHTYIYIIGMGALGTRSAILDKEDNFCDFLPAFLYTKFLWKNCQLEKERVPQEGNACFLLRKGFKKGAKTILKELPPLKVYLFFFTHKQTLVVFC